MNASVSICMCLLSKASFCHMELDLNKMTDSNIHKAANTNQLTVSVSTSFELGSVKNIPFRRPDNFCSVFSHVDGTFIVNP